MRNQWSGQQPIDTVEGILLPGVDHRLHISERHGECVVWLNTECGDYDGLCIGLGATRDAAVAMAVKALEAALGELQKPNGD